MHVIYAYNSMHPFKMQLNAYRKLGILDFYFQLHVLLMFDGVQLRLELVSHVS